MTLTLAVKITGDASGLKQEANEARTATAGLGSALDTVGAKATGAAGRLDAAAAAAGRLGAAERGAAGAASGAAPGSRPSPASPSSPAPRPAPMPGARPTLRADQWTNLGYQGNDIATTLAMGMSPLQVLAQQGPQVAQILADAPGGIAGGFRAIADRAASVLTPVRLLTGGITGLGGAMAYLGYQWAGSQRDIEKGLTGIGGMSRATAGDINCIAERAASGNLISTGQARGVATAIASTGKIDVSNIGGIAELAPGYAQMFGKSVEEAGVDLARIFSDPVKGAEELNARIGGLDASTQRYIRSLVEQGRQQQAVTALMSQFGPEMRKAAEDMGFWGRTWNAIAGKLDTAGEFVAGVTGNGASLQDQAKEARTRYMRARSQYGIGLGAEEGPEVKALRAAYEKAQQRVYDKEGEPEIKLSAARSITAEGSVRSTLPDLDQLDQLRNRFEQLRSTQSDLGALAGMSAEGRRGIVTAIEATQGAVDTFISTQERARASESLTIRSIEARTEAEKAAVAAERERLALAGQAISEGDRRQRIEAARATSFAQGSREAQDRLTDARDRAAGAGLPSYQRQLAELEARTRKALRGFEGNLPAYAVTQQTAAAERAAIDAEAIGGPLRDANRSVTEQAANLRVQQQAFGASTEAASRMAAAQQLVNQYTAAGVPITAELQRGIDAYAASAGKVAAAQDDLVRKQREVVGGLDDVRFGLRGGITGTFSDLAAGKSPLAGILNSVNRTASSNFDRMVSGPLTAALFGQEGKAGGGLFGDAFGGVLGKAARLPTADITAGVVNLSGPISGIPGLTAANGNVPSAASVAAGLGGKGSADAAKGILSGLSGSRAEVADYVKQAAIERGIDPNTALRVINQESGFNVAAKNLTAREQSYGVMQLNTMGGLGVDAMKAGIDVRDPSTWRRQVDFGLDTVMRDGWRQWYGARDIGISRWEGIGQGGSATSATNSALPNLDASLRSIEGTATRATEGVTGLTANLSGLPAPLAQTSQGLTQVGQSLGSGGGGGGLLGAIASLFTGGASAAPASVAAATGGLIHGPGTGTSDSIHARVSNGEFIVNARATAANLSTLRAINENRLPAFAEGGYVGAVPPAARWDAPARAATANGNEAAGSSRGINVQIINNAGAKIEAREVADGNGGRRLEVQVDEMVAQSVGRAGSASRTALGVPSRVASR
ncbi:phage tail length tape measure family protein [Methylorubrum sp. SL192]|uniref:phage tail length tape measure family protein n=1 Tax=Methylorubrum sp. SL192 TaxID=2995167 RepID=UPI002272FD56|nr:phage tail length tape measure family protein [Methylorubrum sp. SL192]MCY1644392.1 phage tail length tape measure family protein [Methylorubrum sp. SL192]